MRRRQRIAVLTALLVWSTSEGVLATPAPFRLKESGAIVALPPLARVIERHDVGTSWSLVGRLNGGLELVFDDFRLCLTRQGWRWNTVMVSGQGAEKMTLVALQRGPDRLLLMIWETGPGVCGFSIGEDQDEA